MYFFKALCLVGVAIGLWISAPIIIAIGGTAILIMGVRYLLKEHADVQKNQTN
jgi:protein-S-isoprenylcysteine O-methyltransferase Ste14